jgi:hypothetical protein
MLRPARGDRDLGEQTSRIEAGNSTHRRMRCAFHPGLGGPSIGFDVVPSWAKRADDGQPVLVKMASDAVVRRESSGVVRRKAGSRNAMGEAGWDRALVRPGPGSAQPSRTTSTGELAHQIDAHELVPNYRSRF